MHGSVQIMHIISRYYQRADARSAWSTPAENMGTATRPGRPAAGAKHRTEPIRTPGVGVRSAEPGGSDRARVPAALGPVTEITSPYRYYSPYRSNFSRLNIPPWNCGGYQYGSAVSCDTSFFSYGSFLCAVFHPFAALFHLQSHFSCEAPESIQGMDMGLGWLRFFAGRKGERMMVLGEYHDQLSANSETGDVSRFKGE